MKLRKKTLYILHYTFYILIIITLSACSGTTEVSKGSLSGTVNLEEQLDLDIVDYLKNK